MTDVRFYAACLASYNNGVLHGVWVDASSDVEEMQEAINAMLRESKFPNVTVEHEGQQVPSAEEWAVHDSEGLPSSFGEYPSLATIAAFVERLEAFEDRGVPAEIVAQLEDHVEPDDFQGVYQDLGDYAEQMSEGCYDIPKGLENYINWDSMGHDMELNGDIFTVEHGYKELYVFSNH